MSTSLKNVYIFEKSRAYVKRFGTKNLLGHPGKDFDRARYLVPLHEFLEHQGRRDVYCHPRVVPFAVPRRALDQWIVIRHAGLLRSARNAVEVGDIRYHRLPASVRRYPGRRNARNSSLHAKTVLFKDSRDVPRSLEFLKSQFAVAEDLVHHLLRERLQSVHFGDRFLLERRQFRGLLREEKSRQKKYANEPCDSKPFFHGTS